jgi:hypothetical protein
VTRAGLTRSLRRQGALLEDVASSRAGGQGCPRGQGVGVTAASWLTARPAVTGMLIRLTLTSDKAAYVNF